MASRRFVSIVPGEFDDETENGWRPKEVLQEAAAHGMCLRL